MLTLIRKSKARLGTKDIHISNSLFDHASPSSIYDITSSCIPRHPNFGKTRQVFSRIKFIGLSKVAVSYGSGLVTGMRLFINSLIEQIVVGIVLHLFYVFIQALAWHSNKLTSLMLLSNFNIRSFVTTVKSHELKSHRMQNQFLLLVSVATGKSKRSFNLEVA